MLKVSWTVLPAIEVTSEVEVEVAEVVLLRLLLLTVVREAVDVNERDELDVKLPVMFAELVALPDADDVELPEQDEANKAVSPMAVQPAGVTPSNPAATEPSVVTQKIASPPTKAELTQTKPSRRPKVV